MKLSPSSTGEIEGRGPVLGRETVLGSSRSFSAGSGTVEEDLLDGPALFMTDVLLQFAEKDEL